ncbi:MAG: hypothetical protein ACPGRZ_14940 [Alphaproteobacteria bacterium]
MTPVLRSSVDFVEHTACRKIAVWASFSLFLGVVLIILGILVNNYAYMTDLVGNSHEGLIYLGWRGIAAAILGLLAVALGVISLLRASDSSSS